MTGTPSYSVKYLGVSFYCKLGQTDLLSLLCKFYSQFNSISSVIGQEA